MKKNLFTLKSTRSSKQKKKKSPLRKEKPLIIEPYITEKSFNLIEKEQKLTFIVDELADKTARTIDGKKAFAKFKDLDSARDLATKLGLV